MARGTLNEAAWLHGAVCSFQAFYCIADVAKMYMHHGNMTRVLPTLVRRWSATNTTRPSFTTTQAILTTIHKFNRV